MKTVILAGGRGTRLAEETDLKPKPMVEIGGIPILRHIMNRYHAFGFSEFLIALGYRGDQIADYLDDAGLMRRNGASGSNGSNREARNGAGEWSIEAVDTGLDTATGGRVRRLAKLIGNETFMLTYGDGVADIDIAALVAFHRSHGRLATVTAVHPPARFGALEITADRKVTAFAEKPLQDQSWVNGGYFVLEPAVLDLIEGDHTSWEQEPVEQLAHAGELMAYYHPTFWQCMDTINDRRLLEAMWLEDRAPWRASLLDEVGAPAS